MDLSWIISLISGAAGGNIAGMLMKAKSLGTLWNSILGIAGGGLGQWAMGLLNLSTGNDIVNGVAGGGVGGAILLFIVSLFKKAT